MGSLKQTIAIPIASHGLGHYWKGNTDKGLKWLKRANSIAPTVIKGTIFEAYLGLALHETGDEDSALKHLQSARKGLSTSSSNKAEIQAAEKQALKTINALLTK